MDDIVKTGNLQDAVRLIFEHKIPFNEMMGLQLLSLSTDRVQMKIKMRQELVGHFIHHNLHGGVTATILDVTGSVAAFMGGINRSSGATFEEQLERFNSLSTIDLRVDYLRPGKGKEFIASSYILRAGNKVAVTRMELHNEEDKLIATGTAAYTIS